MNFFIFLALAVFMLLTELQLRRLEKRCAQLEKERRDGDDRAGTEGENDSLEACYRKGLAGILAYGLEEARAEGVEN